MADTENPMLEINVPPENDVSQEKNNVSKKLTQYLAAICVSLGALCAGSVLAWTSPVLPQLVVQTIKNTTGNITRENFTPIVNSTFYLTDSQGGVVGSMLALGALISAIPSGYLADKFGRRTSLLSLTLPYMANWILIIYASNPGMLYAARFFAGLATGAMCVCAPMYIGEIAEASIRGALGSFFQMFICTGILLTYIIGALFYWKTLSVFLASFPIIFAVCFYFMPETPVYLLKINKKREAKVSLKYFRGQQYVIDDEMAAIQKVIDTSSSKKVGLKDLVSSKGNKKSLISGIGIMVLQQFSGINAVIFYTATIFQSAGSTLHPDIAAIIVGIVQLVFAYVSVMVIERAGRRFFLSLSAIGMASCTVALGIYFHLKYYDVNFAGLGVLPLASMMIFIMSFSLGFGPVPWMILSELFAPEIKGVASGLAVMTNWICVFIVTFSFPLMNSYLGEHITFYLFTIIMVLGTLFVHFYIPETRGKSLQEIQDILNQ